MYPISNDRTVSASINLGTREGLSSLEFCSDDIVKIIRSLDQNTAYDNVEISICLIELCASSILKSVHMIFRN